MSIANAHRWEAEGAYGWLVTEPGGRWWSGEAADRQAANDEIMDRAREAGCAAVIITARHPNDGRACHG